MVKPSVLIWIWWPMIVVYIFKCGTKPQTISTKISIKLWHQECKTSGHKATWVVSPTCMSCVIFMRKKVQPLTCLSVSLFSPNVAHSHSWTLVNLYQSRGTIHHFSIKSIWCPSLTRITLCFCSQFFFIMEYSNLS